MAQTVTSRLNLTLSSSISEALDLAQTGAQINYPLAISIAHGLLAGQMDKIFSDTRTLATGANEDLDLAGSLTDALGVTFTIAKLNLLFVYAKSTNTTNITVARTATTPVPWLSAAAGTVLKPGGILLLWDPSLAGIAVGAGATDTINFANSAGASGVYDVIIGGRSA
jgi:hypothetical protein